MHPRILATSCLGVLTVLLFSGLGLAQSRSGPVVPPHTLMESKVDSGYIDNASNVSRVVFQHRFKIAGTAWLQLRFGEATNLPTGSFLRMTAKKDAGVQRHDGITIGDWAMMSALFNGGEVLLELVAGPNTEANHVTVDRVTRGLFKAPAGPETICGPTDDRVKSSDKRQGRLWRGCSGWLIGPNSNSTGDLMITAGHCRTTGTKILELNVPNSTSGGSLVRSAPNDQYPYTELAGLAGGVGADWAVCLVGKNSNTSMLPTQANGGVFYKIGPVPTSTSGQNITITGYGTSAVRTLTQVQKTHTGPLTNNSGRLCYATDTTGGNSGSVVIHANTGNAIGIHTHGGCSSTGGCNSGTRIDRSDLQAAIKAAGGGGTKPGVFTIFGAGCKGTGKGPSNCASNNAAGGSLGGGTAPNEYAYIATTATALKVTGFEVYSQSTGTGSVTVQTAIYGDSGGVPSTTPLATGTMTIGTVAGFYATTLSANIPAGRFYVSVDHSAVTTVLSTLSTGASGAAYWRRPPMGTSAWALSGIISRSSFKVQCAGGGSNNAVPLIGNVGLPVINSSFKITLSQGKAGAVAVLLTGGSNTTWSGGPLPFSLAVIGAPGCNLLVDPLIPIGITLAGSGNGSINVSIPNNKALVGQKAYE